MRRCRARGLTLVEMVVSILLVGMLLVAAFGTIGATQRTRYAAADQRRAWDLAQALMSEILEQQYADEEDMALLQQVVLGLGTPITVTLGLDLGEPASTRAPFDDIDDYHGWTASPPQEKDGTVLSNLTGWTRSVAVATVQHSKPTVVSSQDDGLKRITVTVQYDGTTLAELVALRSLQIPDTQACCLPDGSTLDMTTTVCAHYGGTSAGAGSNSLNTTCPPPPVPGPVFEGFVEQKRPWDGQSFTIDPVPGTQEGDLLIAAVVTDGQTAGLLSAPVGWQIITTLSRDNTVSMAVWWKLATASEPTGHTFSWGENQQAYGWIMRFTAHDPVTPINAMATATARSTGNTNPTSPAAWTTVPNTLVLRIGGFDDDDIVVNDPGLPDHTPITMDKSNLLLDTVSGGAGYVLQGNPGDTGTSTFSLTQEEESLTVTIAIAPADTEGG